MITAAITPGSIKARVIEAIMELEDRASSHMIRGRHPGNHAAVNTSLEQLSAEGFIQVNSEGMWELTPAAKKTIRGQTITQAVGAIRANGAEIVAATSQPKPETKPQMRKCEVCKVPKALAFFRALDATCNTCRAEQRKQQSSEPQRPAPPKTNGHTEPPSPPPPRQEAATVAPPPSNEPSISPKLPPPAEVVIPAPGSIICRAEREVCLIIQYKQSIAVGREQLPGLIDWLCKQVSK